MKKSMLTLVWAALCVFTLSVAAPAMAGTATNVATYWQATTAMEQNFSFGNPVSTSTTALPTGVKDTITWGTLETYLMAAIVFGP